ncbi:MAG TPA: hypothetical protein VK034_28050 [Enhygromyxa sp.]|nr:hypothetical protein [Enhygromyxa sp.]
MAELNIRLQIDPETGKKNLIIEYESDADMLPIEHEEEHRRLVNALVEGGVVKAEELGKVTVERQGSQPIASDADEAEQADERESNEQTS